MYDLSQRHPIESHRYAKAVGKLLPHRLGQILKSLGFVVKLNKLQANGVDMRVEDKDGNLFLVAEILNWSSYTGLSQKRLQGIIRNLEEYDCTKVLIYTAMKNDFVLSSVSDRGICLLSLKYQVLPLYFFVFFALKEQVTKRIIDNSLSNQYIRVKLIRFLETNRLLPDYDDSIVTLKISVID